MWRVCVFILTPSPYIYRREPRPAGGVFCSYSSKNRCLGPMRGCHIEGVKRWGPWAGRPTRVVGRPHHGANHPQPSPGRLVWASPCLNTEVWSVLSQFGLVFGLHLVHLSLILYSDIFCDFLSGQSVLATYILAQKHILHISKGKVWFKNLFE